MGTSLTLVRKLFVVEMFCTVLRVDSNSIPHIFAASGGIFPTASYDFGSDSASLIRPDVLS